MRTLLSVLQLIIFGIWALICVLLSFLFSLLLFSKKPTIFCARKIWTPIALFIMGAKTQRSGLSNIDPNVSYVVMANHSSYLDIPALMKALPINLHFIAKKELKYAPFLGWYLMLADMILIDRKNTAKAKESLKDAAKLIKRGRHVAIFPEGTASKTGAINSFKKGGFYLAQDAEATIIPVRIKGSDQIWPSANKLKIKPGTIDIVVGDPIPPAEYGKMEMHERANYVRTIILNL